MLQSLEITKSDFYEKFIIRKLYAPKLRHKTNFFRLLALSQKAGLGMRDALYSIRKSETNQGLCMIIDDIINQLTQGYTLSATMRNHTYVFNDDEIALIESAEVMGNMPEILEEIADELEKYQIIQQKIKKASTYPLLLLFFSFVAIVILLIYVVPTIVGIFPSQESLPQITKIVLSVSNFFQKARLAILFFIIGIYILLKFLYKHVILFKIFVDSLMVKVPVVSGVTKTFYMYRFSKLLGQFYSAGISPILSLKLISNIFDNFLYKRKIIEIKRALKSGFTFAESMEGSKLFDPILVQIIHVGEDTGNISQVLKKISEFYSNLLQNKIAILLSLIEPLLIVFIAIIIGMIMGAIFLPMADLVNVIQ